MWLNLIWTSLSVYCFACFEPTVLMSVSSLCLGLSPLLECIELKFVMPCWFELIWTCWVGLKHLELWPKLIWPPLTGYCFVWLKLAELRSLSSLCLRLSPLLKCFVLKFVMLCWFEMIWSGLALFEMWPKLIWPLLIVYCSMCVKLTILISASSLGLKLSPLLECFGLKSVMPCWFEMIWSGLALLEMWSNLIWPLLIVYCFVCVKLTVLISVSSLCLRLFPPFECSGLIFWMPCWFALCCESWSVFWLLMPGWSGWCSDIW